MGRADGYLLVALQGSRDIAVPSGARAEPLLAGDFITIVGILCMQAMIVFEKRALGVGMSPQQVSAASSVVAVATFVAVALVLGERVDAVPVTLPAGAVFLYLVAVPGVFLFYVKRWLTSALDVSFLAAFQNPERVLAIGLAMAVLGEKVSSTSLLSFGIILAGTVMASRGSPSGGGR